MKLLLVISLLALQICATPTGVLKKPKRRIFGGMTAEEGEFPYQVYIHLDGGKDRSPYQCSGAILSKDWIITAGFCASGMHTAKIQAGSNFLSTYDPNRVTVEAEKIYEYNNPHSLNTIGLIKLKTPLTLNGFIQPIGIWKDPVPDNTLVMISGWGAIMYFGNVTNYLQYTGLRVLSAEECKKAYEHFYDEYRMCANSTSSRIKHTCKGDEGNPLVWYGGVEPLLVGISLEYGERCGKQNYASGFIRVDKYVDWIQQITGLHL